MSEQCGDHEGNGCGKREEADRYDRPTAVFVPVWPTRARPRPEHAGPAVIFSPE